MATRGNAAAWNTVVGLILNVSVVVWAILKKHDKWSMLSRRYKSEDSGMRRRIA